MTNVAVTSGTRRERTAHTRAAQRPQASGIGRGGLPPPPGSPRGQRRGCWDCRAGTSRLCGVHTKQRAAPQVLATQRRPGGGVETSFAGPRWRCARLLPRDLQREPTSHPTRSLRIVPVFLYAAALKCKHGFPFLLPRTKCNA